MSKRLPLFYTVTAFFWFALYAYVPYVTPYAEAMGADLRLVGLIAGAYGFTQMVVRFPLGVFSDKLQKRKLFILLGLVFAAVSGLCVFFFPSPLTLLLARSFGGVAASAWVTFVIMGASYYPPSETTKSVGILNAANALGRMAALLLGGFVAQWFGVGYVFLLGGLIGLVGLILGIGIVEKLPDTRQKPPSLADLLEVARNHQLLCASLLGVLIQFIMFATTFGFTPLAATLLAATQLQLGLLGVASTIPGLLISPLAGTLLPRKLGVKGTLGIGFALAGLGSALVPFCQELWQLFAVQIIGNTGAAAVFTLLMGLCIRDIPPERRATAMGFFQAVYGLGMFLGPFAMGWLSHGLGLMPAFFFTGAVGGLGIIAAICFANRGHLRFENDVN